MYGVLPALEVAPKPGPYGWVMSPIQPYPDMNALELLVSVGELGSISAAAQAHGVSQPAASMRLSTLERQLKIQLLERAPTGTRLTQAGLATAAWAAAVLSDMRALLVGTAALQAEQGSHLQVAASLTVAEYLIPRWLGLLATELPKTRVSLEMGNTAHVADWVASGEAELGFIEGPRPPGRLRSRELLADKLVIVVARDHPWSRRRRPVTARELAATPLVLREPGSGTRDVLTVALNAHGLDAIAAMELGSTTAIKAAVAAGAGPAVLSALAVRTELQAGQLVAVGCPELSLQRSIRAIWAAARPPSSSAARLLAIAAKTRDSTDRRTPRPEASRQPLH
jgi:DNA-binding transcriptional LysR family regulator